jgi:glutathione S-transferase
MEKVAQLIYETKQRPEELQLDSWITRLKQQLHGALNLMETSVGNGQSWLFGENILQPDLSTAVAWGFAQHIFPEMFGENDYSGLVQFSARAEATQEFLACPMG